jgi:hypothetical protein
MWPPASCSAPAPADGRPGPQAEHLSSPRGRLRLPAPVRSPPASPVRQDGEPARRRLPRRLTEFRAEGSARLSHCSSWRPPSKASGEDDVPTRPQHPLFRPQQALDDLPGVPLAEDPDQALELDARQREGGEPRSCNCQGGARWAHGRRGSEIQSPQGQVAKGGIRRLPPTPAASRRLRPAPRDFVAQAGRRASPRPQRLRGQQGAGAAHSDDRRSRR